jgi:hypothetical protein
MPKPLSKRTSVFPKCGSSADAKAVPNPATSVVFIHSLLDDYGLSASVFRVYCHLARRAGKNGIAWSSVDSISEVCRLHPQTVRKALQLLVRHRLLRCQQRKGRTTHYRLAPPSEWRPQFFIDDPAETNPSASNSQSSATNPIQGHPSGKDVVEGNPSEGIPLKVDPENTKQTHSDVAIGIPGSVEEAITVARQLGIDESFAAQEFHSKRAVGWKDGYRNSIVSWRDHLMARWHQEQRKRKERRSASRPSANRQPSPSRHFGETNYQQSVKDF